jgi:septal ring factor EnvC (AmiA/AmiB activator)
MVTPAEMSPADRAKTRRLAAAVIEAVASDTAMPLVPFFIGGGLDRAYDKNDVDSMLTALAQKVMATHEQLNECDTERIDYKTQLSLVRKQADDMRAVNDEQERELERLRAKLESSLDTSERIDRELQAMTAARDELQLLVAAAIPPADYVAMRYARDEACDALTNSRSFTADELAGIAATCRKVGGGL